MHTAAHTPTGWLTLAEVSVQHAFYAPQPVPALRWQPTAATAQTLQRSRLRLAPTAEGFALLAEAADLPVLHARVHEGGVAGAGPFALCFTARCGDPLFAAATEGLAALGLLDTAYADAPDADGWRTLATDGAAAVPPGLLDAADRAAPPPLVLHLQVPRGAVATTPGEAGARADMDAWAAEALNQRWRIALAARAPRWKYLLPAEWAAQQPRIVDLAGEVPFDDPIPEALADGRMALGACSQAPIALRQRPPQRFQLQALAPAADRVLVRRLPAGHARQLQMATVDGARTLVAAIHVLR
jgi:hypothetical protein